MYALSYTNNNTHTPNLAKRPSKLASIFENLSSEARFSVTVVAFSAEKTIDKMKPALTDNVE